MKAIKFFLLTGLVVAFAACEDNKFLDLKDPDSFDESKFYQSEADLNALMAASYQVFRNATNYMYFVSEMKSDNSYTLDGASGGMYQTFSFHQVTSSNTIVTDLYTNFYKTIHRANLVTAHIDDIKWTNQEDRARLLAEAKFMRAMGHFYLVRLWGPVVILDHIITSTKEANTQTRSSEEDVYKFIIADLNDVLASNALPATYAGGDPLYGHATMTAVNALLGRVYLQYAATLQHPELYANAITYLQQAISVSGYNGLQLSYSQLFDVDDDINHKFDPEIIFSVQYKATADECSNFCMWFEPTGIEGLTCKTMGKGHNLGTQNLYNEFESSDNGFGWDDRRVTTAMANDAYGRYTKKYVSMASTSAYGENNFFEMRFADVYLMLAEAYERIEGNESENAITYLDKVRMRTGNKVKKYTTAITDSAYVATYPTLRAAIFHERRVEFCFENLRWFDLQRLYPDHNDLANYMRSVNEGLSNKFSGFQAYEALLPIPYDETYLNPNLGQNEGYTSYK